MRGYIRTDKTARHGHRHNKLYDGLSPKFRPGPGGINCPCCTKFPPAELKLRSRRSYRRNFEKQVIREELDEI